MVASLVSSFRTKDFAEASKQLRSLKLALAGGEVPAAAARQTWEIGALLSIKEEDTAGFERCFAQLKAIHLTSSSSSTGGGWGDLPESEYHYPVLGMYLLLLLMENRLAEFHSELEAIPYEHRNHSCISYPVTMEQYLMEGSFFKVLTSPVAHPEYFQYFVDSLLNTVRDEVAACAECSYDSLAVAAAMDMLKFSSEADLANFVKDKELDWDIKGGRITFPSRRAEKEKIEIPSLQLIGESLSYATELDRIV